MMPKLKLATNLYRSTPSYGIFGSGVDRERKAIFGHSVMEIGPARSHGEEVDEKTLDALVEHGNRLKMGVKGHVGHEDMSTDAFGDFAGRDKNFRKIMNDGKPRVIGDFFFDASAFIDPERKVERIMLRAESDPSSFGFSAVVDRTLDYRLNEDGTRKKDDDDNELLPLIRPLSFLASDIVDNPAATTGMFSASGNSNAVLSYEVSAHLDRLVDKLGSKSVDILKDVMTRPDAKERVWGYVTRYLVNRGFDVEDASNENKGDDDMSALDNKAEEKADNDFMNRFGRLFGGRLGGKDTRDEEDGDKSSVSSNVYMHRAASSEVGSFIRGRLGKLNLTPGVRNVSGLTSTLSLILSYSVLGDRNKEDEELVEACPTLYDIANECGWEASTMLPIVMKMFSVRDPFGVVLKALGSFPDLAIRDDDLRNLARERKKDGVPVGGDLKRSSRGDRPTGWAELSEVEKRVIIKNSRGAIKNEEDYNTALGI